MNLCIAITTFNRVDYLKKCVNTWRETKGNHNWELIVADNGSTDGTVEWCESFSDITLIENKERGLHYQINSLLKHINRSGFDICFMADDDVYFSKPGWDDLYINAMKESNFEHLVYHNQSRKKVFIDKPILKEKVASYTDWIHALGCFYTVTQNIIDKVGYYDIRTFGPHESAHIDYTYRCCKAGFNTLPNPFDAKYSNEYVKLRWQWNDPTYEHSLDESQREARRCSLDPLINELGYVNFCKNRLFVPHQNRFKIKV